MFRLWGLGFGFGAQNSRVWGIGLGTRGLGIKGAHGPTPKSCHDSQGVGALSRAQTRPVTTRCLRDGLLSTKARLLLSHPI